MKTGAEIMLGAVERFGNFLPEEKLTGVHDSQACECQMCRWADEAEKRRAEDEDYAATPHPSVYFEREEQDATSEGRLQTR